jgi:uncharacterized protein
MKRALLDTGPLVALLDRSDGAHARVVDWLPDRPWQLVTTGAVITEAMFFLQDYSMGPDRLTEFLARSATEIFDAFTPEGLEACSRLMATYADTPMDFADATLVTAATALKLPEILTLDERGFRTFRFAHRRSFHLLLQDS